MPEAALKAPELQHLFSAARHPSLPTPELRDPFQHIEGQLVAVERLGIDPKNQPAFPFPHHLEMGSKAEAFQHLFEDKGSEPSFASQLKSVAIRRAETRIVERPILQRVEAAGIDAISNQGFECFKRGHSQQTVLASSQPLRRRHYILRGSIGDILGKEVP